MTTTKRSKTTKKKSARKAPAKTTQTKSKSARSAKPRGKAASFALFLDALVQQTADGEKLKAALSSESARRGVKNPGLGGLRSHVKYRQARGQLTGVNIKW